MREDEVNEQKLKIKKLKMMKLKMHKCPIYWNFATALSKSNEKMKEIREIPKISKIPKPRNLIKYIYIHKNRQMK